MRDLQLSFCFYSTQIDCPEYSFSVLHIHKYWCPWRTLRGVDAPRTCQSWMYHTFNCYKLFQGNPDFAWGLTSHHIRGSGIHLLIKIQESVISRWDMCHLHVVYDNEGQWDPSLISQASGEDYVLHCLCPVVFINPLHLEVIYPFLFQLPFVLIFLHCFAIDICNVIRLGAIFHWIEHAGCKLGVFHHQNENLVPPVRHLLVHLAMRPSNYITYCSNVLIREAC